MTTAPLTDRVLTRTPPLTGLKFFLAAAKYQNFTRAADALCVTQSAVSRQVRELEAHLGCELFNRTGRRVELTNFGRILYDSVSVSFSNIAHTLNRIKTAVAREHSSQLSICMTSAFSLLWMAARLADFRTKYPDIDVCLITTDNFQDIDEMINIDIYITPGAIKKNGCKSTPLFVEKAYPVCSPAYLEKHPDLKRSSDLLSAQLLHLNPMFRSHTLEIFDWDLWFEFKGVELDKALYERDHDLTANSYQLLIQMALDGQGIALGWNHLVKDLESSGKLVRPVCDGDIILEDRKHYMTYCEGLEVSAKVQDFITWLLEQFPNQQE
ncbi:LysR substrate-binding domain-containing protein [Oceanimonas doudoroffii]|uniref:LysR substrate-binding domain-containing protein n=1 Tax=Oceanimonas doudoroffii TaxID=84158 RepID=UPI00146CEEC0|nr:LysR substrate-binding domain-containing protein [Oceanimonas doudoroffii]